MAVTSFIPSIWNAEILLGFRAQAVAASLANRSYEGDASAGNVVKIQTGTAVAITDYKAATRLTTASALTTVNQDLLIDQEKSFDFYVDDIDRAQVAGGMDAFTRSAAEGLAEDADKFILSTAVTGAGSTLTASTLTTGDDAFNLVRDLRKALNKAKTPIASRALVINSELEALLLAASSRITSVDTSGNPDGLRNASVGRLLGFDVYVSENMPNVAKPQALAFYQPAVAFVSQVEKTEAMRATDKFADRLRGLHVYGAKVVRSSGVVTWTST